MRVPPIVSRVCAWLPVLTVVVGCGGSSGPCAGQECSGHGVCFAVFDTPYCECARGFHPVGLRCQANDTIAPCRGIDCDDHGSCVEAPDGPLCDCEPGYTVRGLHCLPPAPLPDGGPDPGSDDVAADDVPEAEAPEPRCGNGVTEPPEACDDGDEDPWNGCRPDCTPSCVEDGDCDDGNPCTADRCADDGARRPCEFRPAPDGEPCEDGSRCNGVERCAAGLCGAAVEAPCPTACRPCDEGLDACVPAPAGSACSDGLACTEDDACDGAGACAGTPVRPVEGPGGQGPASSFDGHPTDCVCFLDVYYCSESGAPLDVPAPSGEWTVTGDPAGCSYNSCGAGGTPQACQRNFCRDCAGLCAG